MRPTASPTIRPTRTHRTSTSIETLESRIAPAAFVVTTLSDVVAADGLVSLREAISAANTKLPVNEAVAGDPDGNSITFDPSLFGVVELNGPLIISDDLTIDGTLPGGDVIAIDGLSATRLFLIDTAGGAGTNHDVAISHIDLVNGKSTVSGDNGGAISLANSKLTVNDVEFDNNTVLHFGGAISADHATLEITNSSFSGNKAMGGALYSRGGAIFATTSTVTIKDSSFYGNQADDDGGGIDLEAGSHVTLTRVDFDSNSADHGGAISIGPSSSTATLDYTSGVVSNNHAASGGGGIAIRYGYANLRYVDFDQNSSDGSGGAIDAGEYYGISIVGGVYAGNTAVGKGGAISSYSTYGGTNLTDISGAEFHDNASGDAGGALRFETFVTAIISNSVFYNNSVTVAGVPSANQGGGAIWTTRGITIVQSTFSDNTTNAAGGNLHFAGNSPSTISNSTVAGGTAGLGGPNIYQSNGTLNLTSTLVAGSGDDLVRAGGIVNVDHSLVQDVATGVVNGTDTASIYGQDPLLGSFGDHGGLLPIYDLQPGSPAIDAGSDPYSLPTDQRGAPFQRTEGAGIDIGAFESLPFPEITFLANGKKAQFRDVDGDLVTISTNRGAFDPTSIFLTPEGLGGRLVALDISFRPQFAGANISIKAVRSGRGGDGFVNVSNFDAFGIDLGNVLIDGDVTNFVAGDGDTSTPGVNGLSVVSIGEFDGFGDINVTGALNSLKVRTDVTYADITVSGGPAASLGKVKVTGSVLSTDIEVDGSMSSFGVFGNVIDTGLFVEGSIGTISTTLVPGKFRYTGGVTIKGSLIAGDIGTNGDLANLRVSGEVQHTLVSARGNAVTPDLLTAQTVGNLAIGGRVTHSDFLIGYDIDLNPVNADVQVDKVVITGSWVGSNLAVGAEQGADGLLGTADDEAISGGNGSIVSRIASLTIKGAAYGTPGYSGDFYGVAAQEIVKGKVALTILPLSAGAGNDLGPTLFGVSFDFAVHEVGTAI